MQNIERYMAMYTKDLGPKENIPTHVAGPVVNTPAPPKRVWPKSIVISNIQAVSSSLRYELATPLNFTKIAVEQVSVHGIYTGAPGRASDLQISLNEAHGSWNISVPSLVPYGRFSNREFVKTLERNFNSVTHSDILTVLPPGSGQKMVTLHGVDAPDTSDPYVRASTVFVESVGNEIPMDKLVAAMKDETGTNTKVSVIQKIPPGTVLELPLGGFAVSRVIRKDFPGVDRPCISVVGIRSHLKQVRHREFDETIQEEISCDYDYGCTFSPGEIDLPLRLIVAIAECRDYFANCPVYAIRVHVSPEYATGTDTEPRFGRVVGVRGDVYPEKCSWLCKTYELIDNDSHDPGNPNTFDFPVGIPKSLGLEDTRCVFKVYTGSMLADSIENTSADLRDCPVLDEHDKFRNGIFDPRVFYNDGSTDATYLLQNTVALAGAYCTKYGTRFKDRSERCRMLTQIQENPLEYGRMCSDVVVIMLVSPFRYDGNPLTHKYRASNSIPCFRLSGKGCRLLGIATNTESVDLGDSLYSDGYTETLGLTGTCGFQFMCGIPVGMMDAGVVTPQRLLGYISVNGVRAQGTIHGSRHSIDLPVSKAYKDVYEPRQRVGVDEPQPRIMSSVGIQFETVDGVPVNGEYTVVLSVE